MYPFMCHHTHESWPSHGAAPDLLNRLALAGVLDRISVGIGAKLLELIPGRVSTECDARLAYDTEATIAKGRRLVGLYADRGVPVERLYIKIASTWEGIKACEQLQREGVSTNMTLLFDFGQVSTRSAFVGCLLCVIFLPRHVLNSSCTTSSTCSLALPRT